MVSTQKIQHTGNKHGAHVEVGAGGGESVNMVYTLTHIATGGGGGRGVEK